MKSVAIRTSAPALIYIGILLITLCIALLVSGLIAYQQLITIYIVALLSIAFSRGIYGIKIGFLGWLGLVPLGYRTIYVTEQFPLHPLVVVIWLLLSFILLSSITRRSFNNIEWRLPLAIYVLGIFWIWGLLLGFNNNIPLDLMAPHLTNFLTLIPIMLVAQTAFKRDKSTITQALLVFFIAATIIAALGSLEYYFPEITRLYPSIFTNNAVEINSDGFPRAPFSFFGQPSAAFICALALPFSIFLFQRYKVLRTVILIATTLMVLAIYISGFRVLWLAIGFMFVVLPAIQRRYFLTLCASVLLVLVIMSAPQSTSTRFETLISALSGRPEDSSAQVRFDRMSVAYSQVASNPFGQGWGSAGWVHNDFLQFAVDVGIIGAALYLMWYLSTLGKLILEYRRSNNMLYISIFGSLAIAGIFFNTQPIYVLSQFIIPIWFVWTIAEYQFQSGEG